jgi:Xaa-Pro aminopeptidase
MNRIIFFLFLILIVNNINAQGPLPTDYLTKEFHAERRNALRQLMPDNSVIVVFAFPERAFSWDVNYTYHPNPDLYYFSGYKEPGSVLLIFKEMQGDGDAAYNELFYVRKKNPLREQWTGRRLGVEGVQKELGFKQVFNADDFKNLKVDFTKFNKIIYDAFPTDIGNDKLLSLVNTFKLKANITQVENKELALAFDFIENHTIPSNVANRVSRLKVSMDESDNEEFKNNPLLLKLINNPDTTTLASVIKTIKSNPNIIHDFYRLTASLREIKTPQELGLLRKSVFLSAIAHKEVMKAITPKMSETELSGIFEYVHKKYGAEGEGYPPIVGAGANGCILHYMDNNVTEVKNTLVLMDVASEYHGYSADITRTVPSTGKFTIEQKAIYQLVLDAQEDVMKICKEGTPFASLNEKATEVLIKGLLQLGIIKDVKDAPLYILHSCSHHMGLDVHDKSITPTLKQNMVMTVEPGIYIPKGSPCDPRWWNIAVRIEDDVLIGKNGCENLSVAAPRKIADVEAMTAGKSIFNDIVLPKLK